jgi:hypothetical protein
MATVRVTKECGCFKRSGMAPVQEFDTKDAALMEAKEMADEMNETFCQKHEFSVIENGDEILVNVAMRD